MSTHPPTSLEAKIVILGAQGVGKTTLIHRYIHQRYLPPAKSTPTIGASFLTTTLLDPESGKTLRLQIWDTAGQERFRSISKLYYRGAHAAILCYDVSSQKSFEEMGGWLRELREFSNGGELGGMVVHVVGTKGDVVAKEPGRREVPFERAVGYVAEHLYPDIATPGFRGQEQQGSPPSMGFGGGAALASPNSNRSSGFWGSEAVWDCCHEVSSKDGEGIDEVFRVITRKLVEQQARRADMEAEQQARGRTPGLDGSGAQGYFDLPNGGQGSFRLGHAAGGDKRRSWLGFPTTPGGVTVRSQGDEGDADVEGPRGMGGRRCC